MTDHISSLTFETIRQHTLSWRMPGGDLTLHGYSRAADGTAFMIPELWIGLDAGRMVHTRRPEHLFITHTHSDHVFELPHLKTRRKPPTIYAPTAMLGLIEQYCEAAQRLTDCEPDPEQWVQLDTSYHLVGVEPGDRWKMALKGRDALWVEAVRCDHTVPCLGYRFLKPQRRLKEAFRDRPGGELAALRAEGVVLEEEIEVPLLTFLGDTTHQVFLDHPEVLESPVVLVECTFFAPDHKTQAARTGHMHWEHLESFVCDHPNTIFMLTHASHRYRDEELGVFAKRLPSNARLWLNAPHT